MTWKDLQRHLSNLTTDKLNGDVVLASPQGTFYPSSVGKIDGNLAEEQEELVEDDPILVCNESNTVVFALPIFDGDNVIDRTEGELTLDQLEEFIEAACRAVELNDDSQLREFMRNNHMVD